MRKSQTSSKCTRGVLVIANMTNRTLEVICSMFAVEESTQSCPVFLKKKCNDSQMEVLVSKALVRTL